MGGAKLVSPCWCRCAVATEAMNKFDVPGAFLGVRDNGVWRGGLGAFQPSVHSWQVTFRRNGTIRFRWTLDTFPWVGGGGARRGRGDETFRFR